MTPIIHSVYLLGNKCSENIMYRYRGLDARVDDTVKDLDLIPGPDSGGYLSSNVFAAIHYKYRSFLAKIDHCCCRNPQSITLSCHYLSPDLPSRQQNPVIVFNIYFYCLE